MAEEQREVHMQQAADFELVLEQSRGNELPDADTLAQLGEDITEQMYRNIAELQRALATLQLGGADLAAGSFGFSLWTILSQLEENICDKRSHEYEISFEARFQADNDAAAPSGGDRRRALLVSGGGTGTGGGGSSGGKVRQAVPRHFTCRLRPFQSTSVL